MLEASISSLWLRFRPRLCKSRSIIYTIYDCGDAGNPSYSCCFNRVGKSIWRVSVIATFGSSSIYGKLWTSNFVNILRILCLMSLSGADLSTKDLTIRKKLSLECQRSFSTATKSKGSNLKTRSKSRLRSVKIYLSYRFSYSLKSVKNWISASNFRASSLAGMRAFKPAKSLKLSFRRKKKARGSIFRTKRASETLSLLEIVSF